MAFRLAFSQLLSDPNVTVVNFFEQEELLQAAEAKSDERIQALDIPLDRLVAFGSNNESPLTELLKKNSAPWEFLIKYFRLSTPFRERLPTVLQSLTKENDIVIACHLALAIQKEAEQQLGSTPNQTVRKNLRDLLFKTFSQYIINHLLQDDHFKTVVKDKKFLALLSKFPNLLIISHGSECLINLILKTNEGLEFIKANTALLTSSFTDNPSIASRMGASSFPYLKSLGINIEDPALAKTDAPLPSVTTPTGPAMYAALTVNTRTYTPSSTHTPTPTSIEEERKGPQL